MSSRAFAALVASLIVLSSTLIANIFSVGKSVVLPTPVNDVVATPTADAAVPT